MLDKPIHRREDWEVDCLLGEGGLSEGVYKAKKIDGWINGIQIPNGLCAIKIINKERTEIGIKEVNILNHIRKYCRHPNIIDIYGYGYDENEKLYIYLEYLDGYKTIKEIINIKKSIPEVGIQYFAYQLLQLLNYLHNNNIVHRDIKCENIMVNENGCGDRVFKLIDFGVAEYIGGSNSHSGSNLPFAGTLSHMSPEIINNNYKEIKKSDIYSYGCTLLEMAGGDLSNRIPNYLSNECIIFIRFCLDKNEYTRANPNLLLVHPFFKNRYRFFNKIKMIDGIITNDISTTLNNSAFNQPIKCGEIPDYIMKIQFDSYNQPIQNSCIPYNVNHFELKSFNCSIISNSLPHSITYLELSSYNQVLVAGAIPPNVRILKLQSYNQPLDPFVLPGLVRELYLQSYSQILLPGSISNSVESLDLSSYNHPLDNVNLIPDSVTELDLSSYNHPITNTTFSKSLIKLILGNFKQVPERGLLPESIKYLILESFNEPFGSDFLPSQLLKLTLGSYNQHLSAQQLPNSITSLILLSYNLPIGQDVLPPKLKDLVLQDFNQPIILNSIPESCENINLWSFNQEIKVGTFPSSLQALSLVSFNQDFEYGAIPLNLKWLNLDSIDLNENGGNIPDAKVFSTSYNFKAKLNKNNNLPKNIGYLFLSNYNQPITLNSIPPTVFSLTLGSNYKDFNSLLKLPNTIIILQFGVVDCELSDEQIKQQFIPDTVSKVIINRSTSK